MNLKTKSENINQLGLDLRAEYLVSCLVCEGIKPSELLAVFDGDLKRKWTTDIGRSEIETFGKGKTVLSIHLNRAGIYDSLPEALLHETSDSKNATGEEMAKDSMRLKAEEKQKQLHQDIVDGFLPHGILL